ncbi:glycosyltransferase family 2 protein [Ferrimonas balearica]|nr:glycosyltransferase family 2 protein [Ferrimonas balearica]
MTYKVSIIIPCYNREKFIGEAIRSALSQGGDCEIVVVDDGSTDGSWERIKKFVPRVRAVRTTNAGPSSARNTGVSESSGRWIKFLDSDDLLVAGSVQMQLEQIEELPPLSIPVGQLLLGTGQSEHSNSPVEEIDAFTIGKESIQVSRPLIPRAAFEQVGGFRPSTGSEDHELVVRMAAAGWRFFRFETNVTKFRNVDPGRLTNNLNAGRFREILSVYKRMEADLFRARAKGSDDLRHGVGVSAWSIARRCARLGYRDVASDFFALASRLAGRSARVGSPVILVSYFFLGPIRTENLASLLKKTFHRFRT